MKPRTLLIPSAACLAATFSTTSLSSAQDAIKTLEPMTVVGSADAIYELPGSAAYVEAADFRERGYTNLAQITAKIPGVYVRDEDGFGNFPNISLRGVDGTRSTKVTVMEDGILTAPAPYSAPNAYYAPKAGRMSGIEFLKGSSQVKYGPQTTGGVVNYLSTTIPEGDGTTFYNRTTYGSYNTLFQHTWYGDTQETAAGRFGYLLEFHGESSDGFRDIDGTTKDSGFSIIEPMLKLFWEPETALKQRIELKAGYTSFDANETYTGLSDSDLRDDPDRRYAASKYDEFESEQWRSYLKWIAEPSDALRIESAVYYNSFERTWDKLGAVVLPGSSITTVAEAMLAPNGIALLKGFSPGSISTADAYRDHEAYGWQNQVNYRFQTGSLEHDLAVGLRLHYDQQNGDTTSHTYASTGNGSFDFVGDSTPVPIVAQEVFATALFIEDQIAIGKLTLRPGIRYEWLELEATTSGVGSDSLDESLIMGGLGANYEFNTCNSLFGGVYRGSSPANPFGYLIGTENEESLGAELGFRHRQEAFRAELVGFYTNFDQLIAPEIPGGAGSTPSENGGSADVWGIESLVEYDAGKAQNWTLGLPVYASATFTNAEFSGMDSVLSTAAATFAGGRNGNEIPYIPEWKFATSIGLTGEKWAVRFDASYTSTSWGTGFNGDARPAGTNASAMDGKIDSLLIFDLTGHYQLTDQIKLVGGIQNLFDERAIVSRAPLGARSNAPQMMFAGFEATF